MWSLAVAPDGTLWAGTNHGVARFDGKKWESFNQKIVITLAIAPNGDVWCGSGQDGKGIMRFGGGQWETFVSNDGLANDEVNAIAFAPGGALWLATEDGGLSHFDGQTWKSYIPADGLTNTRLSSVVVTADGAVWVGAGGDGVGGGGLSRYTP